MCPEFDYFTLLGRQNFQGHAMVVLTALDPSYHIIIAPLGTTETGRFNARRIAREAVMISVSKQHAARVPQSLPPHLGLPC